MGGNLTALRTDTPLQGIEAHYGPGLEGDFNFVCHKGKVIDFVELSLDTEDYSIEIRFNDNTALTFDMEPEPG